jgi:hypothetical protein
VANGGIRYQHLVRGLVNDQAFGSCMAEDAGKDRSRIQMDANMAAQRSTQSVIECNGSRVCTGTLRNLGLQAQDPGLGKLLLEILEKCIPSHGASVGPPTKAVN